MSGIFYFKPNVNYMFVTGVERGHRNPVGIVRGSYESEYSLSTANKKRDAFRHPLP